MGKRLKCYYQLQVIKPKGSRNKTTKLKCTLWRRSWKNVQNYVLLLACLPHTHTHTCYGNWIRLVVWIIIFETFIAKTEAIVVCNVFLRNHKIRLKKHTNNKALTKRSTYLSSTIAWTMSWITYAPPSTGNEIQQNWSKTEIEIWRNRDDVFTQIKLRVINT